MQNNYLLIISCSERKMNTPAARPAIDLYDGVMYRMLRKAAREGRTNGNLDILIISARYGLIGCQFPITAYDEKMTPLTAMKLRPEIQARLKSLIDTKPGSYTQVYLNLGKTYRQTLEGFHWGLLSTMEASGAIGQRVSQVKAWLDRIGGE